MNYYLDCEFLEQPGTIELISIGIYSQEGEVFYAENSEYDLSRSHQWLKENVHPGLHFLNGLRKVKSFPFYETFETETSVFGPRLFIGDSIIKWIGDDPDPKFYGYYCDYDWVVFCWCFGAMIDLPKHFPMYCIDLKQMMDYHELDSKWKDKNCPDPKREHNAAADAMWNKQLHLEILRHLYTIKPTK